MDELALLMIVGGVPRGEASGQILADGKVSATIGELTQIEPRGELTLKGFWRMVQAFNLKALQRAS